MKIPSVYDASGKCSFYFSFVFCVSIIITVRGQSTPCTTPNGEKATCVSLVSCPILLQSASKDALAKKFVEASACPGGTLHVCCGKSGNYTQKLNETQQIEKPINESSKDYVLRNKLLPDKKYCGLQHTDDYFYNETATSVDEFPWLVYFMIPENYVNNFYLRKESNCVGVLISNLYILTSYWTCLQNTSRLGINHTVEMILGQHHIYKDVSCIPTRYDIDDCTQPIQRVVAYVWFTAPSFYSHAIPAIAGIGILRLHKKIEFSDYVRPICLPLEQNDVPKPGDVVFTSGWGEQQSVDGKTVKLKKRILHTVMDNEECENANPVMDPVCGIPFENNTHYACPGDNGGPFMYKHKNNWIVTAIVTETTTCDDVHPVIAERLTPETMNWIFDAIVFFEKRAKDREEN